jgi:hypothetical protein
MLQSEAEPYVSLIIARNLDGTGWMEPPGAAYVTYRDGKRISCARAWIEDVPEPSSYRFDWER